MALMTEKQRAFVAAKVAGVGNRDAAIAAGYAPSSARVAASKLMARDDIVQAIKAAAKPARVTVPSENPMPRDHYADSKSFLEDVMNHVGLPFAVRMDAAKQLLPFHHAKMGELGKKEKKQEAAEGIAKRGRFVPKQPPALRLVTE